MAGATAARAEGWFEWRWNSLGQPCAGDCSVMVFGGRFVETGMSDILLLQRPGEWEFGDGGIVGIAASRTAASLFNGKATIEAEAGLAKRFGNMDELEAWGAFYLRYRDFPWNHRLYTTAAVSTGLSYASGISDRERASRGERSDDSRLMHYFSPEITFAHPERRDTELVLRFHHRSGVFGLVNDDGGGAQYATVGLRFRF